MNFWKNLSKIQKGLILILGTALISGFSIFINKFAINAVGDSSVFTAAKNISVALILSVLILTPFLLKQLKKLQKKDWFKLIAVGLVGGSIPFLLFFKGLSLSSSISAAFIHKSLFIWVGLLGVLFLKEKLSKIQLSALALLLIGNFFLIGGLNIFSFSYGSLLIFAASLFWAVEFIMIKKFITNINPTILAWARMFFGSIVLVTYLSATGSLTGLFNINYMQFSWIMFTGILLLGYVLTWYHSLTKLPAVVASSVLVIGSPITTLLKVSFSGSSYTTSQIVGSLLITISIFTIIFLSYKLNQNDRKIETKTI